VKQLDGTGLKRLHRDWRRRTSNRVGLILDGVTMAVNVGSIVRSAAAFGVERLWCVGAAATPASPGAARTALGTERYVTWSTVPTVGEAIDEARAAGYRVVGLELVEGARPLHELDPSPATCLVVGHEDHGLSKATLAAVDEVAFVPLVGRVGSLNVAVASSIALYELRRAEWTGPTAGAASHPERVDLDPDPTVHGGRPGQGVGQRGVVRGS